MAHSNMMLIEWRDAASNGYEKWSTVEDAVNEAVSEWNTPVLSLGWLVEETDDYVILATQKYEGAETRIWGTTLIPKGNIVKRRRVK